MGAASAQDGPLKATVGDNGAEVRGGPDQSYYATGELEPGTPVEIHRLDPGQWCAIRPPDDSFGLVRADAIQVIDSEQGIGEVVADGEQSWIGTQLGEVDEPMWQVKLKRGERVQLLGAIPAEGTPGEADWYQIAPPRGEFRWLHVDELDPPSQTLVRNRFQPARRGLANKEPKTILVRDEQDIRQVAAQTAQSNSLANDDEIQLAQYDQPVRSTAANSQRQSHSGWRRPQRRRPIEQTPEQFPPILASNAGPGFATSAETRMDYSAPAHATTPVPVGPGQWPLALQELDVRLSTEILKDPGQWRLDSIAADVARYRASTTQASDIATAEHLANKIRQFQLLQTGTPFQPQNPPTIQGVVAVIGNDAVPLQAQSGLARAANAVYPTSFDATGWLNELVRDEGVGQTTYVLQDDAGKITHVITPTPGLNLHRYLKTKVAIVGQKGFHQKLKLDHVAADRVVSLDALRR